MCGMWDKKVRKNFVNTVMEIPFDSYSNIAHYWEIRQRGRRYMLPMSNYIEWYVKAMDPYLDNEVVDFAINLPLELKIGKKIIYIACKSIFPRLSDIPFEPTAAPPITTGSSRMLPIARRFDFAKAKSAVEIISFGKILFKPKDYRGYGYWLRTGSKKYVEDVLLRDSHEIFDQEYVKRVVKRHMKRKNNHNQLICDLINFKLMHKRFFTGDAQK
jgi:asparagine synthetase B (glutamine-hydrolysing)